MILIRTSREIFTKIFYLSDSLPHNNYFWHYIYNWKNYIVKGFFLTIHYTSMLVQSFDCAIKLLHILYKHEDDYLCNFLRMDIECFYELLSKVWPQKKKTLMIDPISPHQR